MSIDPKWYEHFRFTLSEYTGHEIAALSKSSSVIGKEDGSEMSEFVALLNELRDTSSDSQLENVGEAITYRRYAALRLKILARCCSGRHFLILSSRASMCGDQHFRRIILELDSDRTLIECSVPEELGGNPALTAIFRGEIIGALKLSGCKVSRCQTTLTERGVVFDVHHNRGVGLFSALHAIARLPFYTKDKAEVIANTHEIFHRRLPDMEESIESRRQDEAALMEAHQVERERLMDELHDSVAQDLTGISYLSKSLQQATPRFDESTQSKIQELFAATDTALEHVRTMIRELDESSRAFPRLEHSLKSLCEHISNKFDVKCSLKIDANFIETDSNVASQVYMIVREAVLNAVEHGQCQSIIVYMSRRLVRSVVRIEEGRGGFECSGDGQSDERIGSMRKRAQSIGAEFTYQLSGKNGALIKLALR